MRVIREGSVRVDLVGGTLDLEPINLILPNVVTLNVATGLKARVELETSNFDGVEIFSKDYNKNYQFSSSDFNQENLYSSVHFKEMSFLCQILDIFKATSNLKVTLSSGAPPGSGLGGSSAMGVTLYSALCEFCQSPFDLNEAVLKVKATEGRVLNQGVPGYQDYFPALAGGILCVKGEVGRLTYEQLFTPQLKEWLETHITLVYSGVTRNSGINNWEVYKAFFDKDEKIRAALQEIAQISYQAYESIKSQKYSDLLRLLGREGAVRRQLAATIVPAKVESLVESLAKKTDSVGFKMCGAGGGGCFILAHNPEEKEVVQEALLNFGMEKLDFTIDDPIQYSE